MKVSLTAAMFGRRRLAAVGEASLDFLTEYLTRVGAGCETRRLIPSAPSIAS